jgi:hypothetical protein
MVFHGKFDGRSFVQFMQRLLKQAAYKIYLIDRLIQISALYYRPAQ